MAGGCNERTTRRAVAAAKARWRAGHVRAYRPWITELGLWLQWDWGQRPAGPGPDGMLRETLLFCAWLAWSRFRVVLSAWDRTLPTLIACLDATLRRIGGAPVYALTDNEKTVTVEHVAGVRVRHPEIVAVGRHYGMTVHTCVPYDPESKGGAESTMKIAKADLVPAGANLREAYRSFDEMAAECGKFCEVVNGRAVPVGVTLRDDMGHAGRFGCGQQVICPFGAQPDSGDGPPVEVLQVGLAGVRQGNPGHLMHDHLRLGRRHRLTDRHRIQPVHHDRRGAQLPQQAQLGRARRRRRHLMAPGHQLRHQPPPHDPGSACHEHAHDLCLS